MSFHVHNRLLFPALAVVGIVVAIVLPPLLRWMDPGPDRLARAERLYADLVERGVPPQDAAWEPVIALFESVPRDSKAWPEAERRLAVVRELRTTPLPGRPLARPDEPDGGSPSLDEHGH